MTGMITPVGEKEEYDSYHSCSSEKFYFVSAMSPTFPRVSCAPGIRASLVL